MKDILLILSLCFASYAASIRTVNIGSAANDGTGDDIRTGFAKMNTNILVLSNAVSPAGAASLTFKSTGSTTARNLADRFSETRNVKDFGAAGDGTTDDTESVRAAYAAIPTGGGTLLFPPGKYKFNLAVTNYNIHIQGSGSVKASNGGDSVDTAFIPADLASPVIQVGNDSYYVRGFQMTGCTIYGGAGPYGDTGLYFAGGATECFVRNVAIWNFKYNVKYQSGSNYPCTLIFIDGFTMQSSSDSGARCFYAYSPAWVGNAYTTGIYLSNGHVNGPTGSSSYAIELDGVAMYLSNVYFDLSAGKGVKLKRTNGGGAGSPYLVCSGVAFDHPHDTSVLIDVESSSYYALSSYLRGSASVRGQLQLADGKQLDLNSGIEATVPFYSELSYPRVYGAIELQDTGNTNRTDDVRLFRSGTQGYYQNRVGNLSFLSSTYIAMFNNDVEHWRFNLDGSLTPKNGAWNIGSASERLGYLYAANLDTTNATLYGQILMENNKVIFMKDFSGTYEGVLSEGTNGNVVVAAPTSGGSIQLSTRSSSGHVQIVAGGSTEKWRFENTGKLLPQSTYDIGTTSARAGTGYFSTLNTTNLTALGTVSLSSIPAYTNNAAAVSGGLAVGRVYRTGADPDVLCVVH